MATVRKRSWNRGTPREKSAWIVDYFDQDGKRRLKTFKKQREAKAWLAKTLHEVEHGTHTPESQSITVAQAARLWFERCALLVERGEMERSTKAQYKSHLDHIAKSSIGNLKLARLTMPAVTHFCDELLRGGMSLATTRKVLTSLKTIIGTAQTRGLVAQNAASTVRFKKDDRNRELAIPTKEEVRRILDHADKWRPILITAALTGLRSSELRGLMWSDVDLDKKMLHVRRRADYTGALGAPKSRAGTRAIPLAPPVVHALKEHQLALPKPLQFVFPNGRGRVDFYTNIKQRGFARVQVKAGVVDEAGKPKFGMHALRHFFASWAIEQGFSPKKVQALLGHATIAMTFDRYGHLFPSLEDDHAKFAAGALTVIGQ
jgi:integrase